MSQNHAFKQECETRLDAYPQNDGLKQAAQNFMEESIAAQYSYNFSWMGRPIIQYPQDMIAMQEIIWQVQPDLIIETGIAHGGSIIFSAAMLELNAACGGAGDAEVLAIDIDIRAHNRAAIEAHPMMKRITLLEGSSVAPEIVEQVYKKAEGKKKILISLDSNHTHEHVLAELEAYAPLTSLDSYCVVFDTIIEDLPPELLFERPWGKGDNAKTAVHKYLETHPEFEIDARMDSKLLISVAPHGYLKRVK